MKQLSQHRSNPDLAKIFLSMIFMLIVSLPGRGYSQNDSDLLPVLVKTANTFSSIIEDAKPAVVNILVKKNAQEDSNGKTIHQNFFEDQLMKEFFGSTPVQNKKTTEKQARYDNGSGFIISEDGYILTNHHVVKDAVEITLYLQDKRQYRAELIGSDAQSDIALLHIKANNLPTLPLGDSNTLRVGEWAIAIGSPFEFIQTVTVGIISAKGRSSIGVSEYEDFIQTDAAINPGNSGGPLLNIKGEVVGINTAFMTQSGGYMGVGFAVPATMAKTISNRLKEYGKMTRGWLGVALKDASPEELKPVTRQNYSAAAKILRVSDGSPAHNAELKQNDMIVALNNVSISGAADFRNRIALTEPGTTVNIQFIRAGKQRESEVRLKELKP